MKTHALFVGLGLLAASFGPAFADNVTANVTTWDSANGPSRSRTCRSSPIPKEVAVPDIKAGDLVTVDFEQLDNGYDTITRSPSATAPSAGVCRRRPRRRADRARLSPSSSIPPAAHPG